MIGRVSDGSPEPLGLTLDACGANVAVYSAHARAIELCLFDAQDRETKRILLPARSGDVFHGHVEGLGAGQRYGLRAHGPFAPMDRLCFNPAKLLIDPYAAVLDRVPAQHSSQFSIRPDDPAGGIDTTDSAPFVPKAVAGTQRSVTANRPRVPWSRTVLYELHVRGLTRQHPRVPEDIRGTFAALADPHVIDHFSNLGVTTLELMPCAAWLDEPHLVARGLTNYWGYNPVAWLAPDPRLAPGGWAEIAQSVAALHEAGLEVLIDVVLNHSGEGSVHGPTVSLRGLDNATYYRHDRDGRLIDTTGCGNTVALDRPAPMRLAMDALRAWALYGGVDGFRFDLAPTMGRRDDGFDPHAPLIAAITQDPVLRDLKLIAEPWDLGPGGYRLGGFPAAWGEWNDRFRDTARRFWRGESGLLGDIATRLAGSSDVFSRRAPSRSVNFITAHDGFTLADLVAYTHKHNDRNGEDNRDGTDANHSWNNGVEGPSEDPAILAARGRDRRALIATLILARGTPMLSMGDEFGRSQGGNNNAYAQDNATSWMDWTESDDDFAGFVQRLIALRRAHPALAADRFLDGHAVDASGLPDIEWRAADGTELRDASWQSADPHVLVAAIYAAAGEGGPADRVVVAVNAGTRPVEVKLPAPRHGFAWRLELDTALDAPDAFAAIAADGVRNIAARSVVLLTEAACSDRPRMRAADPRTLDRLAQAAGIAPDWTDVAGRRHVVPEATKRALLEGMGLPCGSDGQAYESLAQLAGLSDRRPLPGVLVRREGAVLDLRVPAADGRIPGDLALVREDGSTETLRLGDRVEEVRWIGCDGRGQRGYRVRLPAQPVGRHRLMFADRPEIVCHVTIAPRRCHALDPKARLAGLAAQLYSVRRQSDQGIGDFTTLAELAVASGRAGLAAVGLNPMHALFAADRERASPYYPSDRRFLDPIYLDLDALPIAGGASPDDAIRAVLRARTEVDYPAVWSLKDRHLEAAFADFTQRSANRSGDSEAQDFAHFVREGGAALHGFALFEAIAECHPGVAWTGWPAPLAGREPQALAAFAEAHAERLRYHQYLQFLCDRQFAAAAAAGCAAGLALGFYRDLAVGAAPDGAEAWTNAPLLIRGAHVGAPPDPIAETGQNWGLPPPDPWAWRDEGYAAFAELLRANMRHAGALRIDHVMGLTRLFVIPQGAPASDGAYLSYPVDDLVGQVALESARAGCVVVGEDLGTVPDGLRDKLAAAEILSYRVLWFERDGAAFKPPSAYPHRAMACVSTHDLPTLAGWWEDEDIREKLALGLFTPEQAAAQRAARADDRLELLLALRREHLLPENADANAPVLDAALVAAIHAYVGRTAATLAMVQIDDLAGERVGVNLPGSDRERPNWRRKLAPPLADMFEGNARIALQALRQARDA